MASLAKWLSVRLRTKCLRVRVGSLFILLVFVMFFFSVRFSFSMRIRIFLVYMFIYIYVFVYVFSQFILVLCYFMFLACILTSIVHIASFKYDGKLAKDVDPLIDQSEHLPDWITSVKWESENYFFISPIFAVVMVVFPCVFAVLSHSFFLFFLFCFPCFIFFFLFFLPFLSLFDNLELWHFLLQKSKSVMKC